MYPIKKQRELQIFSGKIEHISPKPTSYGIRLENGEGWINGKGTCPYEKGEVVHVEAEQNEKGFWWITEEKSEKTPKKERKNAEKSPEILGKAENRARDDEDEMVKQLRRIADSLEKLETSTIR